MATRNFSKPLKLLLLGSPGSGKGTQTSKLCKLYPELNTVSSGDLLRQQIKDKTKLGSLAATYMLKGQLLPDELINNLVLSHLGTSGLLTPVSNWLLDGYPRTASQAKMLDIELSKLKCNLNLVVELDVPEKVILERIENRYVHIPSGRIYNLQYNPPKVPGKDDITGEPLSKRPDDTADVYTERLKEYNKTMAPLKEFYQKKGILKVVSGETSDIIFPKLCKVIQNMTE